MKKDNKKMENDEKIEFLNYADEAEKSKPYLEKFEKAKTFNSDRKNAYAELMAFYQGNQHLLNKYKNDTPWVVNMNTPYATVAIDNRVSSILANDYIGELLPLGVEDVDTVDKLASAYKREWKRMELDNLVRDCIGMGAVVREAYIHVTLDPKETIGGTGSKTLGKMSAYVIEPARIFIDPSARCLSKARYMFVSDRIDKTEAIEKYPKLKGANGIGDQFSPSERGEVYYDNDYNTEQDDVLTVLTYYGKEKGKIKTVKLIKGVIVEEKDLNIKNFPIAQFRWRKAAQSCYGLSLMDEVLSLQKAITSIESAVTNTAVAYAAPSMMVRKGCGVDPKVVAKANGAPGVVYAVDGDLDNAIKPVVPPQVKQEILNIKNDYQNQINTITGNTQQFLGNIGTAGNTSGGTDAAIKRATIIENKVLANIREFIEDLTEIILDYIKQAYGEETLSYNDGKINGQYQFTNITLPKTEEMENSKYNYYIELETKTPYNKDKQKELLLNLYQLERQYDTPIKTITVGDIIKNTDIENKDEIISRYNNLTYQDANTKADVITQLYGAGVENGVDAELLKQAMAEIIANSQETPAVDQVMQMLEQAAEQEIQQANQRLDQASSMLMATPGQQANVQNMAEQIQGQDVTNIMNMPQESTE